MPSAVRLSTLLLTLLPLLLTLILTLLTLLLILQLNTEELCAKRNDTLHITFYSTSHITDITSHITGKCRGAVCQAQRDD